ncbi:MAG: hemolysin family protein [Polyangiales bacterium]
MWGLLLAIALVILNGFFVAAEFSMVRVRPARLERLAKKGSTRAAAALKITSSLERYLSVSQIGITLCSLALGWVGEPAIASLVERAYYSITGHDLGPTAHAIAVGLSFSIITFFHVLVGEQAPKLIALQRSEQISMTLALPFRIAFWVLAPVRLILEGATKAVLRMFGMRGKIASEGQLSEEELLSIIAATMARGPGAEDKRQLLERVIRFASRQARHAMVPRVDVAYLPIASSGQAAIEYLRREGFTRVVLTKGNDLDRVSGYLYAKDLLFDPNALSLTSLDTVRRDVLFVPEPQSLIDVLRSMQHTQTLFAIVVDEYGGTSGLLTMEDLVEEIVGEIRDEADEDEIPNVREVPGSAGVYDVEATASVDELRPLGVDLGDDEHGETVGGYMVKQIGRVPRHGDRQRMGPFDAEVRAIRRRRIVRVRLYPRAPTVRPSPAAPVVDLADDNSSPGRQN